jgi:hypothetical protein
MTAESTSARLLDHLLARFRGPHKAAAKGIAEAVAAFVRAMAPTTLCLSCIAEKLRLTPAETAAAVQSLVPRMGFRTTTRNCSGCGVSQTVVEVPCAGTQPLDHASDRRSPADRDAAGDARQD